MWSEHHRTQLFGQLVAQGLQALLEAHVEEQLVGVGVLAELFDFVDVLLADAAELAQSEPLQPQRAVGLEVLVGHALVEHHVPLFLPILI